MLPREDTELNPREQPVPELETDQRRRIEPEQVFDQVAEISPAERPREPVGQAKRERVIGQPQRGRKRDQGEIRFRRIHPAVIELVRTGGNDRHAGRRASHIEDSKHAAVTEPAIVGAPELIPARPCGDELDRHGATARNQHLNIVSVDPKAVRHVDRPNDEPDGVALVDFNRAGRKLEPLCGYLKLLYRHLGRPVRRHALPVRIRRTSPGVRCEERHTGQA